MIIKGLSLASRLPISPEADPGATVRGQIIAPDDAVTYKLLGVDTKIGDTTYKVDYEMAVTAAPTPAPTLSSGDQAAINKMVEMNNYLSPLMTTFSNAAQSGDYATERSTAVSINDYIGENLPEMTQLASSATTQQAVTQEYVSSLEDLQTGMNEVIHAIDDYNFRRYGRSYDVDECCSPEYPRWDPTSPECKCRSHPQLTLFFKSAIM